MDILDKFGVQITTIDVIYDIRDTNFWPGKIYHDNKYIAIKKGRNLFDVLLNYDNKTYNVKISSNSIMIYGIKNINIITEIFNAVLDIYSMPHVTSLNQLRILTVNAKYNFNTSIVQGVFVTKTIVKSNGEVIFNNKSFEGVANSFLYLYNYVKLPYILIKLCQLKSSLFCHIPKELLEIIIRYIYDVNMAFGLSINKVG